LHREEIDRTLDALRGELASAEERRNQAEETLEEARLRGMIGELSADEWEAQRGPLEAEVAAADGVVASARGEVERLSALATEISAEPAPVVAQPAAREPESFAAPTGAPMEEPGGETPVESEWNPVMPPLDPPAVAAVEEESAAMWDPFGNEFGGAPATPHVDAGDLPWLDPAQQTDAGWSPTDSGDGLEFLNDLEKSPQPEQPAADDLAKDDLAFLEELDRAISGSPAATPPPPAGESNARPKLGGGPLLCKECGALNEPHSWYCEICGSEL
ncbi:MAG TPA: hypothetical protein VE913_17150, partial [Longimicrobium sp.]|nr:hypothetical protein [Longimicrobium sp.]